MAKDFSWLIGGQAGNGIMLSGKLFTKAAAQTGLYAFAYPEYPSLIRGGHNSFQVRIGKEKIHGPNNQLDLLVPLNQESFDLHQAELKKGAGIIFDPTVVKPKSDFKLFPLPLEKIAQNLGEKILRNTVTLGASLALLSGDFSLLEIVLKKEFGTKKKEILEQNLKAAKKGFSYIKEHYQPLNFSFSGKKKNLTCLNGNEAIALAAIAAGCKFYCAYPMTPVSGVLHFLARWGPKYGMVVRQAEDEIAVINNAIGAAHAGVRAMVATSGGGFCLMTESFGLAGMTETPLVIVEGQRGSPSTGMPTWTEQGDLQFVLHASHGDFPRFVIAPADINDCFYLTFEAFNLAERFQSPVIVLVDKFLTESLQTLPPFQIKDLKIDRGKILEEIPSGYKRYRFTVDGVSPRAFPGQNGGVFLANSDEHDEAGFVCEEGENRNLMMRKRMNKLITAQKEIPTPIFWKEKRADLTIFSWGSAYGPIIEAREKLIQEGIKTNFYHLSYLSPFPQKAISEAIKQAKKSVFIEGNFSGQGASLMREKTGANLDCQILKYDGRPFYADELVKKIKKLR